MKPRWRWLGLLLAMAMLIASCGSSDEGDDEATDADAEDAAAEDTAEAEEEPAEAEEAPAEDAEPATIRFTWWGNPERDELTNQMVEMFMEEYPHITVETEPTVFDGYFDQLAVSTAAGDAPDVITMGGTYPTEYGANDQLVDLTTIADQVSLDAYDPSTYSSATLDGAVYGLPTGGNATGLLVNLDMFEEAGIDLPDDNTWTWDDFVTLAGELSAALGDDVYGTDWRVQEAKETFAVQRGPAMFAPEGGVGVSAETMAELYQIPVDLIANGGMPSAELTTELRETTFEQTYFGQGKAAMMFAYSNNVQQYAEILGAGVNMLKTPGEAEGPGLTVLPSQYFTIYSGSEHPEEAALLVDWLLNEPAPAEVILGDRGLSFNPAILEAITPLLGEYEQQSAEYLGRIATEGTDSLFIPVEGKGEVDDMTLRLQDEVMFGTLTPEEAGAQWVDEASGIIP